MHGRIRLDAMKGLYREATVDERARFLLWVTQGMPADERTEEPQKPKGDVVKVVVRDAPKQQPKLVNVVVRDSNRKGG